MPSQVQLCRKMLGKNPGLLQIWIYQRLKARLTFQEDEESLSKPWIPPEVKYLLKSFHMFGEFDPSVFLEVSGLSHSVSFLLSLYKTQISGPSQNTKNKKSFCPGAISSWNWLSC